MSEVEQTHIADFIFHIIQTLINRYSMNAHKPLMETVVPITV